MVARIRPSLRLARVRRAGWSVVLAVALMGVVVAEDKAVPRVTPSAAGRFETLSSSSQFLAHGPVQADRSKLVSEAERIREEFALLIDRAEGERDLTSFGMESQAKPLTIHFWVQGDVQPPLQPRFYRLGGAPEPTLGMVVARAGLADGEPFRREVIRLLLAERIMRAHPAVNLSSRAEIVPPWVFTGVVEALDHLRLGAPGARFATLFHAGQIMTVEEILRARPERLDGASREIFAASACSLVLALLEQPQGPTRFRKFLGEMPVRTGTVSSHLQLVRSFPGLALSRHSLEKWWSLQLAQMAEPTAFEPLRADETDRRLAEALVVHVSPAAPRAESSSVLGRWLKNLLPGGKEGTSLHASTPPVAAEAASTPGAPGEELIALTDLDRLMKLPQRAKVLVANQTQLAVLALRAFPLHRPLLTEYQKILGLIIRGKTKGLPARLEGLATRRRELLEAVDQVEDHLNWYDATQRHHSSGSFDSYFKLLDELAKPPPKSDDPITRYLDGIEREFEN